MSGAQRLTGFLNLEARLRLLHMHAKGATAAAPRNFTLTHDFREIGE
ncbi:hypothetical protein PAECIP111802_03293 [Paenibacillus allorhizosphaerae]|uniref:Uncharacterized protein n=1 Tax=Paenibacillus allorhizosphaerae TaxID=2849866 RepID=A0ABN7TKT5_9BACL|nr:hypothetical protein PAECIP111802_03293 [Paenibacillus allorhizosphaerae]